MITELMNHSALTTARERFQSAKQRFTAAAKAALNGDPGAERMAVIALAEQDAARADLNRLQPSANHTPHVRVLGALPDAGMSNINI